ncbi:zeta toxin family protein [Streptomyces sp. NRRL S-1521]|uniref:zeta toxin family protein n=1 Tax=Streptomyces sp. NRRL S-1521 TaxID=1609100 RepID=UPI0007C70C0C
MVYLMGQPGSGKTNMTRMVLRSLRGRPTKISGDGFKAAHPDYHQLLQEEPRTAGARIRADYRAWQVLAEQYVRERRSDAVIEIAPSSAAAFVNSAMLYRQAGYRVELVVLAVRAADSRQGTADRCAQLLRLGAAGRFTTADGHDEHFAALGEAVAAAEQMLVANLVTMMRRDGSVLYRNERAPDGMWARLTAALQALVAEHRRPYSDRETARFWAVQRRLRAQPPHYRRDLEQIAQLARLLMPEHLLPSRLRGPAAVAALPARPYTSYSRISRSHSWLHHFSVGSLRGLGTGLIVPHRRRANRPLLRGQFVVVGGSDLFASMSVCQYRSCTMSKIIGESRGCKCG